MVLALLACGLFGWGAVASISGAVIATGRVEVETRDQVVEHIDGGTVEEILVREGDRVEAGQVLIRFDDSPLRSDEARLDTEHAGLVARRNRLEAEFRDAQRIAWDEGLVRLAARATAVRETLDGQQRLFDARRAARAGRKARLRERIEQTRRQIAGLEAHAVAVERERGFVDRELGPRRTLFAKGMIPLDRLLALEREAARLEGKAAEIDSRLAGARGRIAEIDIELQQIDTQRLEEAESRAREVHVREMQVRERLAAVRRRLSRLEVRAPVAGEVFAMAVFAKREVVQPGEPILRIVPEDADLVVLARLDPIHVDQVWRGQDAVLRFTAFPARATPEFEGRIRRVSADAVRDGRSGLSWYEVEVEIGRAIEPRPGTDVAGVGGVPAGNRDGLAARPRARRRRGRRRRRPGRCSGGGAVGSRISPCAVRRRVAGALGRGPDAGPRHAGRGPHPHRRAFAARLRRQASHRLLAPGLARGVTMRLRDGRRCRPRQSGVDHRAGSSGRTPDPLPGIAEPGRSGGVSASARERCNA